MKTIDFDKIAYSSIGYAGNDIDIVRLTYFEPMSDWKVNFHKHIFYEFHYVLEGHAYTKFRDSEIEVTAGKFYIMQPNLVHAHYQKEGTCHKAFSAAWKIGDYGRGGGIFDVFKNIAHEMKTDDGSIGREILNLMAENERGMPPELLKLDVLRLLFSLAVLYGSIEPVSEKRNLRKDIVDEALVYMNDNLEKNLKATDIADAIHISYAHLSRLFGKVLGKSVKKAYRDMKIQKAVDLLNHSDLTVEQIALQSGFMSLNYFYEVFKKETGITPTEMRRGSSADIIKTE